MVILWRSYGRIFKFNIIIIWLLFMWLCIILCIKCSKYWIHFYPRCAPAQFHTNRKVLGKRKIIKPQEVVVSKIKKHFQLVFSFMEFFSLYYARRSRKLHLKSKLSCFFYLPKKKTDFGLSGDMFFASSL